MIRFALVLVLLAIIALADQGRPVTPVCTEARGGQTLTVKGTQWAEKLGNTIRDLSEMADDEITHDDFDKYKDRLWDGVIRLWWLSVKNAAAGDKVDPLVIELRREQERAALEATRGCATELDEGCSPPTEASGDPDAKGENDVWKALRAAGFNPVHTAGIMGNMQVESGFDPLIVQGGGHSTNPASTRNGYGLVQWTPGRKLKDYIGNARPTVANQVATVKAQLEGKGPHPEKAAGDAFWATDDVASAARVFHLRYERSASKNSSERIRLAEAIYARHRDSAQVSPAALAAPEQCSPDDQPVGDPLQVDNPSGKTTMDGKTVSRVVAAQIKLAEKKSGIDFVVMQGGYGGSGIAASGTSHNYSGVVDVSPGTVEAEKVLRQAGFASWARNVPGRSYVGSGEHNHAVSILDPGNRRHPQLIGSWARNENGLNGGKDPAPHYDWYPEIRGAQT